MFNLFGKSEKTPSSATELRRCRASSEIEHNKTKSQLEKAENDLKRAIALRKTPEVVEELMSQKVDLMLVMEGHRKTIRALDDMQKSVQKAKNTTKIFTAMNATGLEVQKQMGHSPQEMLKKSAITQRNMDLANIAQETVEDMIETMTGDGNDDRRQQLLDREKEEYYSAMMPPVSVGVPQEPKENTTSDDLERRLENLKRNNTR
jgi:hypothetical protein